MSNSFHTRSTSCSLVNLAGMVGGKCWYGKSTSHFSRIKQLQGSPAFCMHYAYTTQEQGELSREHGKAFTSHGLKKVLVEAQASFWKKKKMELADSGRRKNWEGTVRTTGDLHAWTVVIGVSLHIEDEGDWLCRQQIPWGLRQKTQRASWQGQWRPRKTQKDE